jgi:hypothetical protein
MREVQVLRTCRKAHPLWAFTQKQSFLSENDPVVKLRRVCRAQSDANEEEAQPPPPLLVGRIFGASAREVG